MSVMSLTVWDIDLFNVRYVIIVWDIDCSMSVRSLIALDIDLFNVCYVINSMGY